MSEFQDRAAEINDLLCVLNVLTWDARTQMPSGGSATRAQQLATVSAIARARLLDPAFEQAALRAQQQETTRRAASQALGATRAMKRIPERLTRELALTKSAAQDAWARAKDANDFASFAPHLQRMISLSRELADALGYQDHPYDALLGLYEPGLTSRSLHTLFEGLRAHHVPLLKVIRTRPQPRTDFLRRCYPSEGQRTFSLGVAQAFGYDLTRGRLDASAHPFEISFTRQDVRITTRYREHFLPAALFGTLHETGHALYEQNVSPELTRSVLASDLLGLYAVGGASYGTHESQSRLWENRIGRSRTFWELHFPHLQDHFPEQLADVTTTEFHRAVNVVEPSLIRVEADELTYDLHIMLRVDLEMALIQGDLDVQDLPDVWNERLQSDLGLTPPDDARGVLQDIHWSAGLFGSFPTYTIGNVMASQFYEAAQRAIPELNGQLERGDYGTLRTYLTTQVYQHGRTFTPHELLVRSTGRGLDPQPYLAYLTGKYSELYDLPTAHREHA
ncbi:carboxypeptidase M32 [Deinococcus peraridilitoris]|uniref:Metal-dependent carboxypeptidase n=1 Tax=Deinococcus peraridilitoris (strain DSM 19664 / LMG 22246 / CIP 109416 / KR-200) TaxID=937777 RepID=L0A778_DEIPD|nr:carboxypeptidase M32 [Deinococcus peraridilitoris]AFZ69666.1 Zn-dependent carboxypeptidase [Deinococcus peraridilitoris DSM 19664]